MYKDNYCMKAAMAMPEDLKKAKEAAEMEAVKRAQAAIRPTPCPEETLSMIQDQMTSLIFEIKDMTESAKIIIKDEPQTRDTCGGSAGPGNIDLYAIALRQRGVLKEIRDNMQYILTALR